MYTRRIEYVCLLALQIYELHKQPVPDIQEEKKAFIEKLLEFNVSIQQYMNAYKMDDFTMWESFFKS